MPSDILCVTKPITKEMFLMFILVILETVMGGEVEQQPVALKELTSKHIVKHLIVELLQTEGAVANVYIGCDLAGKVQLPMTPKQMMEQEGQLRAVSYTCRVIYPRQNLVGGKTNSIPI